MNGVVMHLAGNVRIETCTVHLQADSDASNSGTREIARKDTRLMNALYACRASMAAVRPGT
jgi:hypothetical protein